jgi:hypothetical protein
VGKALQDGLAYDDATNRIDVTPANALQIDGNGKVGVVESGIDHGNLSGITASDHHLRYADSEASEQALVFDLVGGL